jgi:hypothetical protein
MFPSAECRSGAVFGLAMTGGPLSIRGFADLCPASETIRDCGRRNQSLREPTCQPSLSKPPSPHDGLHRSCGWDGAGERTHLVAKRLAFWNGRFWGSFLTGANEFGDTPSNIAIGAPSVASMATKLSAIRTHAPPQHLVFRGADCFLMAPMRSAFFLGSGSVLVKPANVAGLGPLQWLERG